jgi:hypothetical protein
MDFVPRPTAARPGIGYIIKQVSDAAKRIVSRGDDQIYKVCQIQIKSMYAQVLRLAKMGI